MWTEVYGTKGLDEPQNTITIPRTVYWTGDVGRRANDNDEDVDNDKHHRDEDDDVGHCPRCHQWQNDFLPQLLEE